MFERFTTAARTAVVTAQEKARAAGAGSVGAAHVLLGTVDDPAGIPYRVLRGLGIDPSTLPAPGPGTDAGDDEALSSMGIDLAEVRRRAEETFGPGALDRPRRRVRGHLPFEREAKQALELSLRAAIAEGHRRLGPEHLLLGLLATEEGSVPALLRRHGIEATSAEIRRLVLIEINQAA